MIVADARRLPYADASVHAIVTDPPYGLEFMGKAWDHGVPSVPFWEEQLRVAKPGAHLAAFGGTRPHHRLMRALEDAGWEIRDCLMWVYGSGFPKSLDVSKAIDKAAGAEREAVGQGKGRTGKAAQPHGGSIHSDDNYQWPGEYDITAPATEDAKRWEGWGTALSPSWEPIILARKPLTGTVAANVLEHGVGGLNVDACRVGPRDRTEYGLQNAERSQGSAYGKPTATADFDSSKGRWPKNLIHDGSEEVLAGFPAPHGAGFARSDADDAFDGKGSMFGIGGTAPRYGDEGSAARFFPALGFSEEERRFMYCAKAAAHERGEGNDHPTVKPLALMEWLVKLITPPGGTVLDPFSGSGTTEMACRNLGFRYLGGDNSVPHLLIQRRRLADHRAVSSGEALPPRKMKAIEGPLFAE